MNEWQQLRNTTTALLRRIKDDNDPRFDICARVHYCSKSALALQPYLDGWASKNVRVADPASWLPALDRLRRALQAYDRNPGTPLWKRSDRYSTIVRPLTECHVSEAEWNGVQPSSREERREGLTGRFLQLTPFPPELIRLCLEYEHADNVTDWNELRQATLRLRKRMRRLMLHRPGHEYVTWCLPLLASYLQAGPHRVDNDDEFPDGLTALLQEFRTSPDVTVRLTLEVRVVNSRAAV